MSFDLLLRAREPLFETLGHYDIEVRLKEASYGNVITIHGEQNLEHACPPVVFLVDFTKTPGGDNEIVRNDEVAVCDEVEKRSYDMTLKDQFANLATHPIST